MSEPVSYNFIPSTEVPFVIAALEEARKDKKSLEAAEVGKKELKRIEMALQNQSLFNSRLKYKTLELIRRGYQLGGESLLKRTQRTPDQVESLISEVAIKNTFNPRNFKSALIKLKLAKLSPKNPASDSPKEAIKITLSGPRDSADKMLSDWGKENLTEHITLEVLFEKEISRIQHALELTDEFARSRGQIASRRDALLAMTGGIESVKPLSFDLYVDSERGRAVAEMAQRELAKLEIEAPSTPVTEQKSELVEGRIAEEQRLREAEAMRVEAESRMEAQRGRAVK